ncbi:MAG: LuxR C-terminal-related transcriptional regulator, partial [Gammaproteobacteria bacterium]
HLARGLTIQEAAAEMRISEHTARNYSKRVFAKTGTRRQVELVRVMLHSVALLAAG